jgi:hypothetical protein
MVYITFVIGMAGAQAAYANCEYQRICTIGGECHYELVCDNGNVTNPGNTCDYELVCGSNGCRYERVCR